VHAKEAGRSLVKYYRKNEQKDLRVRISPWGGVDFYATDNSAIVTAFS